METYTYLSAELSVDWCVSRTCPSVACKHVRQHLKANALTPCGLRGQFVVACSSTEATAIVAFTDNAVRLVCMRSMCIKRKESLRACAVTMIKRLWILRNNTHANQAQPKTFVFKYDFTPDHPPGQKVPADCIECETSLWIFAKHHPRKSSHAKDIQF